MSRVGLVLGGGGITGAAYHFGVLFALRLATGWDPDDAEVIVGTSCGAFVGSMVRHSALTLDTLVGEAHSRDAVNDMLRDRVYRRARPHPRSLVRWLRRGLLPGIRRPSLEVVLGSPALYSTDGILDWLDELLEEDAAGWPELPTVVVGYDLVERKRVAFGTEAAPDVPLKQAVAASLAVPFVYEPVEIHGRWYVDGGVASGTSVDLLLATPEPLDLILVSAPMAAEESRDGARFYEAAFDRFGRSALEQELSLVEDRWPDADVLVLRPDAEVLETTRPNPMAVEGAVPTFLRTLRTLRDELAAPDVWPVLERHLHRRPANQS